LGRKKDRRGRYFHCRRFTRREKKKAYQYRVHLRVRGGNGQKESFGQRLVEKREVKSAQKNGKKKSTAGCRGGERKPSLPPLRRRETKKLVVKRVSLCLKPEEVVDQDGGLI